MSNLINFLTSSAVTATSYLGIISRYLKKGYNEYLMIIVIYRSKNLIDVPKRRCSQPKLGNIFDPYSCTQMDGYELDLINPIGTIFKLQRFLASFVDSRKKCGCGYGSHQGCSPTDDHIFITAPNVK